MFAYCQNNPVVFTDSTGFCREVSPLISTKIDCWNIYCPTSKVYRSQCNPNGLQAKRTTSTGKSLYIYDASATVPKSVSVNKNNVVAYDMRHGTDNPNIQVINSYFITAKAEQKEILTLLLAYDASNPSQVPWSRTLDSMIIEWDAHNMFAAFSQSARDTDFDKNEEGMGYLYYVKKAGTRLFQQVFG